MSVFRGMLFKSALGRRRFTTHVDIAQHVKIALEKRQPVVALESTIITHGMPVPENINTALSVQQIIEEQGAVPATIGIIDGRIKVGLTEEELYRLGDVAESKAIKVSRRDLPLVVAKKLNGGTTVAATMVVAHMAGIPVFVTGGIGGVHRGAESTWDVSADLTELGRTPVAVVCSGVKSILDIGRTLEVLETAGVGVASYGPSDDFPAFYCRKSGFKSPCHLSDIDTAVRYVDAMHKLKLGSGLVIAVPVPEDYAINETEIEEAIQLAIKEAKAEQVTGPRVTPFILKNVAQVTKGKALSANMALIKNNARVGAEIAVGLATCKSSRHSKDAVKNVENASNKVTVIGGSVLDFVVRVTSPDFKAMNLLYALRCHDTSSLDNRRLSPLKAWMCAHATTSLEKYKHLLANGFDTPMIFEAETPQRQFVAYIDPDDKFCTEDKLSQADGRTMEGKITWSGGGVARNIADALARLGSNVHFISAVGHDHFGEFIKNDTLSHVSSLSLLAGDDRTAVCMVVCDSDGNSRLLVGDMNAHRQINSQALAAHRDAIIASRMVVFDGNVPVDGMEWLFTVCNDHQIPVLFEPTDILKARIPFQTATLIKRPVQFITPNLSEFVEIVGEVFPGDVLSEKDPLNRIGEVACRLVEEKVDNVLVTLGANGVLVARKGTADQPFFNKGKKLLPSGPASYRIYPPPSFSPFQIVNVNGAGDCFASGFVTAALKGLSEQECISKGLYASQVALKSWKTVPEDLGTNN